MTAGMPMETPFIEVLYQPVGLGVPEVEPPHPMDAMETPEPVTSVVIEQSAPAPETTPVVPEPAPLAEPIRGGDRIRLGALARSIYGDNYSNLSPEQKEQVIRSLFKKGK